MLGEPPEKQARAAHEAGRRRGRVGGRRTTNAPMNDEIARSSRRRLKLRRAAEASASGRGDGYTMLIHQLALIVMAFVTLSGTICRPGLAVSVQRLNVPDLVVVDQLHQRQLQQQQLNQRIGADLSHGRLAQSSARPGGQLQPTQQPEAASLIKSQDLSNSMNNEQQLTFECLISYDRKRDKNLIVKWHHDDPLEPIYQWIVGLDKISIAPKYQPYILAINSTAAAAAAATAAARQQPPSSGLSGGVGGSNWTGPANTTTGNSNQIQLLEASFKLVKPSKELGGKYTCSAISSLNDDSKWKKMIVFNPPRSFSIEAFRTDAGTQSATAAQRERIRKLTQQQQQQQQQQPFAADETPAATTSTIGDSSQLPLAYRRRMGQSVGGGASTEQQTMTTAGKTIQVIDYVNVSENRRQKGAGRARINQPPAADATDQLVAPNGSGQSLNAAAVAARKANGGAGDGVKLVCDIDQVFPVPEVNIYRLANLDGSYPDKLAKLETKIEKNPLNGLYHVQVTSVLSDDEIEVKYGSSSGNDPVYFECLIALTNLELSRYADNKRTIVYHRPGSPSSSSSGGGGGGGVFSMLASGGSGGVQGMQTAFSSSSATSIGEPGHRINSDQSGSSSSSSSLNSIYNKSLMLALIMMNSSLLPLIYLERHSRWWRFPLYY